MKSGIYQILNLINNKFYIGSASIIHKRWYQHIFYLNNLDHDNRYLQAAWNKYGAENFEFKIMQFCQVEELIKYEQGWLDWTKCYEREIGYNLSKTAGNVTGLKRSEEFVTMLKTRIITDETKKKISDSLKGRKFSEEHKSNLRIKKLNVKRGRMSEEQKMKISLSLKKFYSEQGTTIK